MNKKLQYGLGFIFGVAMLFVAVHFSYAQNTPGGLVPCEGTGCHFKDLLELVRRGLGLVIRLILPIGAIIIAYTGFLFLTSGGNEEVRHRAKDILGKAVLGIVFILCAGLIVGTIYRVFGVKSCYNWIGKQIVDCAKQ